MRITTTIAPPTTSFTPSYAACLLRFRIAASYRAHHLLALLKNAVGCLTPPSRATTQTAVATSPIYGSYGGIPLNLAAIDVRWLQRRWIGRTARETTTALHAWHGAGGAMTAGDDGTGCGWWRACGVRIATINSYYGTRYRLVAVPRMLKNASYWAPWRTPYALRGIRTSRQHLCDIPSSPWTCLPVSRSATFQRDCSRTQHSAVSRLHLYHASPPSRRPGTRQTTPYLPTYRPALLHAGENRCRLAYFVAGQGGRCGVAAGWRQADAMGLAYLSQWRLYYVTNIGMDRHGGGGPCSGTYPFKMPFMTIHST